MASVQDQIEVLFTQRGIDGVLGAFTKAEKAAVGVQLSIDQISAAIAGMQSTEKLGNMFKVQGGSNEFLSEINKIKTETKDLSLNALKEFSKGNLDFSQISDLAQKIKKADEADAQLNKRLTETISILIRAAGIGQIVTTPVGPVFQENLGPQYAKIITQSNSLRESIYAQQSTVEAAKAKYKDLEAQLARTVQSFNNLKAIGNISEETWAKHQASIARLRSELDVAGKQVEIFTAQWYRGIGQLPSFDALSPKNLGNLPKVFKDAGVGEITTIFDKLSKAKISPDAALSGLKTIQDRLYSLMSSVDVGSAAYKRYNEAALSLAPVMKDVASAAVQEKAAIEGLTGATTPVQKAMLSLNNILNTLPSSLRIIATDLQKTFNSFAKTGDVDIAKQKLNEYKQVLNTILSSPLAANDSGLRAQALEILDYIKTTEQSVTKLAAIRKELAASTVTPTNAISELRQPNAALPTGVQSGLTKIVGIYEKATSGAMSYEEAIRRIEKTQASFNSQLAQVKDPVMMQKMRAEIERMNPYLQTLISNLKQAQVTQDQFTASSNRNAQGMLSLGQSFEMAAFKIIRYRVSYLAMAKAAEALRGTVTEVTNINYELAQLAKVVDPAIYNLRELEKTAVQMSITFGITTEEVLKSMNTWARVGLEGVALTKAVEATLMGVNAVGVTTEEMTNALTAAMFTYGVEVEDLTKTISAWFAVSNAFPLSAQDIVGALNNVGSAAKEVGIDINDLTGYVAAINAVTRKSGVAIGQSLKTMLARFVRPETENMLAKVGVGLRDSESSFRDVDDVLDDLSKNWDNLTEKMRANIATQVGGIRRYVDFLALMDQYAIKQRAVGIAMTANDEASRAQGIEMDTLKKRFSVLGAEFDKLQLVIGEGIFSSLRASIATLTTFVEKMVWVEETTGLFSSTLVVLGGILKGLVTTGGFVLLGTAIMNVGSLLALAKAQLIGFTAAAGLSSTAIAGISRNFGIFEAIVVVFTRAKLASVNFVKGLFGIRIASLAAAGGIGAVGAAIKTILPGFFILSGLVAIAIMLYEKLAGTSDELGQSMSGFSMPNKQDFQDSIAAVQGYQKQIEALTLMDSRVSSVIANLANVKSVSGEAQDSFNSLSAFEIAYAKESANVSAALVQLSASLTTIIASSARLSEEQKTFARNLAETYKGVKLTDEALAKLIYESGLYQDQITGTAKSQEELTKQIKEGKSEFANTTKGYIAQISAIAAYRKNVDMLRDSLEMQKDAAEVVFKQQYAAAQASIPKISEHIEKLLGFYNSMQVEAGKIPSFAINIEDLDTRGYVLQVEGLLTEVGNLIASGRERLKILDLSEEDKKDLEASLKVVEKEYDRLLNLQGKVTNRKLVPVPSPGKFGEGGVEYKSVFSDVKNDLSKADLDKNILDINKQVEYLVNNLKTLGGSQGLLSATKELREVSQAIQTVNRYGLLTSNNEPILLFDEKEIARLEGLRDKSIEIKLKFQDFSLLGDSIELINSMANAGFQIDNRYSQSLGEAKNALLGYWRMLQEYDVELAKIERTTAITSASLETLNKVMAQSSGLEPPQIQTLVKTSGLSDYFNVYRDITESTLKNVALSLSGELEKLSQKKILLKKQRVEVELDEKSRDRVEDQINRLNELAKKSELFTAANADASKFQSKLTEIEAKLKIFNSFSIETKTLSDALLKPFNAAKEKADTLFEYIKTQSDEIGRRKIKIQLASTKKEIADIEELNEVLRGIVLTPGIDQDIRAMASESITENKRLLKEKQYQLAVDNAMYAKSQSTLAIDREKVKQARIEMAEATKTDSIFKSIEDSVKGTVDLLKKLSAIGGETIKINLETDLVGGSNKDRLDKIVDSLNSNISAIVEKYSDSISSLAGNKEAIKSHREELAVFDEIEKKNKQLTVGEARRRDVVISMLATEEGQTDTLARNVLYYQSMLSKVKGLKSAIAPYRAELDAISKLEADVNVALEYRLDQNKELLNIAEAIGVRDTAYLKLQKNIVENSYKATVAAIGLNAEGLDSEQLKAKYLQANVDYQKEINKLKIDELRLSDQIKGAISAATIGKDVTESLKSAFAIDTIGNAEKTAELRKEEVELEYELQQARSEGDENAAKSLERRLSKIKDEIKDVGTWYGQIGQAIQKGAISVIDSYQKRLTDNFVDSIMNLSIGGETIDVKIGKAIEQAATGMIVGTQATLAAYLASQATEFQTHIDGMKQAFNDHINGLNSILAKSDGTNGQFSQKNLYTMISRYGSRDISNKEVNVRANAAGLEPAFASLPESSIMDLTKMMESGASQEAVTAKIEELTGVTRKQTSELEKAGQATAKYLAHSIGMSLGIELGRNLGGSSKGAAMGAGIGELFGSSIATDMAKNVSGALGSILIPGIGGIVGSLFGGAIGGIFGGDDEKPEINDNTSAVMSNTEAIRANTDALSQLDPSVINAPGSFIQPLNTSRVGATVSVVINAGNASAKDIAGEVERIINRNYEREVSVSGTSRRYAI